MYLYNSNLQKESLQEVDIYDHICWKYGFLHFDEKALWVVLDKLSRYYNVKIHYDSDNMKNILVSGKLDLKGNMDIVLQSIALTAPFDFEINNKTVRIKSKN